MNILIILYCLYNMYAIPGGQEKPQASATSILISNEKEWNELKKCEEIFHRLWKALGIEKARET